MLDSPLGSRYPSFAELSARFNVLLQSARPDEAGKALDTMRPITDTERAWLLSHRAHLAFLKWLDGGKKDDALLDAVLAPMAEILSKCPVESPKQSAMQAFCRVLKLAEKDGNLLVQVRSHLPHFGDGSIWLPPDRQTQGDWPLVYGNSCFVLASFGKLADLANSRDETQGVVLRTGDKDAPARHWQPSNARFTASANAMVLPASQLPVVWQDCTRAQEYLETGRLFPQEKHRRAGWWDDHGEMHPFDDDGPNLHVSLKTALRSGQLLSVHLGDFDWRTTRHPRQQSLILRDSEGGFRNAAWSGKSDTGVYERFCMTSDLQMEITCLKHRGACVAVSGIFIDNPVDMPPQAEGTPLKLISARASSAWETALEAEKNASVHSAVDGYLAILRQLSEPGELMSLIGAFADVKSIHPLWQYAAAGRLAQLNPDLKESLEIPGRCQAAQFDFQKSIPVPILDVLADLKRRSETRTVFLA